MYDSFFVEDLLNLFFFLAVLEFALRAYASAGKVHFSHIPG
jgi:hypothetical protein